MEMGGIGKQDEDMNVEEISGKTIFRDNKKL